MLDNLPTMTAKLEGLVEMVREILDEDPRHKVVVFSYFKPMLAMIRHQFSSAGISSVLITGDVTAQARDDAIVQLQHRPPLPPVPVLRRRGLRRRPEPGLATSSTTTCPGPAARLAQRIARIDRTNSAFDQIQVVYMYGQGTIEERMYRMLVQKRKVARAFLDGEFDAKSGGLKLDLESLREFLDSI